MLLLTTDLYISWTAFFYIVPMRDTASRNPYSKDIIRQNVQTPGKMGMLVMLCYVMLVMVMHAVLQTIILADKVIEYDIKVSKLTARVQRVQMPTVKDVVFVFLQTVLKCVVP